MASQGLLGTDTEVNFRVVGVSKYRAIGQQPETTLLIAPPYAPPPTHTHPGWRSERAEPMGKDRVPERVMGPLKCLGVI